MPVSTVISSRFEQMYVNIGSRKQSPHLAMMLRVSENLKSEMYLTPASMAGCFSRDFYNKVLHPTAELDDLPRATLYARLAVAVSLVIGVAVALRARGILDTIIIFNYPYMASMLVPLLGGLLWPGATTRGAYAAMGVGGVIGIAAFVVGVPGPLHGSFNIDLALLVAFAASAVTLVGVSLLGDARD